jgi:uncharacterized membrane protein
MVHRHANIEHADSLTTGERIACWISSRVGTPSVFFLVQGWTVIWLGYNALCPKPFDPLPGCVLWLLISNYIQLSLMPMLMVAQNIQSRHDQIRADIDHENILHISSELAIVKRQQQWLNTGMGALVRSLQAESTDDGKEINQGTNCTHPINHASR